MLAALSLTLALALQAPPPAFAELDEGKRLYFDLEYELAVFRFKDATRNTTVADEQRALAFAWLGLAYAQVAEMESAREAFVEAARLDAAVTLPADASPPPKALQLLEDAKREVAAAEAAPVPGPDPSAARGETSGAGPASAAPAGGAFVGTLLLAGGGLAAGLGVVTLGTGAVLGLLALSAADQGNAAVFQDDASAFKQEAEQSALAANVSYIVGGVLVAVGVATLGASFVLE